MLDGAPAARRFLGARLGNAEPRPAPFTTIAWRLTHIGFMLNVRANHLFGDATMAIGTFEWPASASAAIAWVDSGFGAYRDGLAGLTDADLDAHPAGPPGYLDTQFPTAMAVQHMTLELIHHGAEVSLLRDLYRCQPMAGPSA